MTDAPPPPRAVLDSDVIFSRVLYDLLGRLATELRMLTLIWSDELIAEAERTLIDRKPLPEPIARRWVGYLRDAFPNERVEINSVPSSVDLAALTADPDDQHVCALAVTGSADLLLTFDQGFLPGPLREHGVEVADADTFLVDALNREPRAVVRVLHTQAAAWGGGRPVAELLDAIERARAPRFAAKVRALLSS